MFIVYCTSLLLLLIDSVVMVGDGMTDYETCPPAVSSFINRINTF